MGKIIYLSSIGTTGDVRPFVFLAEELQRRNHQVTMASHQIHEHFFVDHAIPYCVTGKSIKKEELKDIFDKMYQSKSLFAELDTMCENMVFRDFGLRYQQALTTGKKADFFVTHIADHAAQAAAIQLGKPYAVVRFESTSLQTKYHTPPPYDLNLGPFLNKISWRAANLILKKYDNKLQSLLKQEGFKSEAPLAIRQQSTWLNLCACSTQLAPWYDDFSDSFKLTGQWCEQTSQAPLSPLESNLQSFIEKHEKNFFIVTLGSMGGSNGSAISRIFTDVFEELGMPLIIQSGYADLEPTTKTDKIVHCNFVDHEYIFPKAKGVIHHAGSGTTHSCIKSRTPSIAIPHMLDQFFFAKKIKEEEASPGFIDIKNLSTKNLKKIITEFNNNYSKFKKNAERMGRVMQKENGIKTAADLLLR